MEHFPECPQSEGKFDSLCICNRLRTCWQRALDAAHDAVLKITRKEMMSVDATAWIIKSAALREINAVKDNLFLTDLEQDLEDPEFRQAFLDASEDIYNKTITDLDNSQDI